MKKRLLLILLSCVILISGCIKNPYDRDNEDETTAEETEETLATDKSEETTAPETSAPTTAETTTATTAETTVDPNAVTPGGITITYDYQDLSYADTDATVLITASLQHVTIGIPSYPAAEVVINDTLNIIRNESTSEYTLMQTDAQSIYDDYGMEGMIGPYELTASVEPAYVSDKLVSFVVTRYSYTGGAHGNVMLEAYTFDTRTGDLLTFSDICSDEALFEGYITSAIVAQIDAVPAEDQMVFPEYATTVGTEFDSAIWYFSESGGAQLVVTYQTYSIAPYAAGTPTFSIPVADCGGYLNAYGQALFTA